MDVPATISPQPPRNKGVDYEYLRTEGVRLVQALSSNIWTDYNAHDPGVTTLEQLCYALTELSYRAEFKIADLLAHPETGDVDLRRHGLYTAREILPCNPVTADDYRKLIADRVSGVANVWVTPIIPPARSREVDGCYDITIYSPDAWHPHPEPHCGPDQDARFRRRLKQRVRRAFCRNRNLCEDLRAVHILAPMLTVVSADVSIRSGISTERTMAEILFAVGRLFAPELKRQPLNDLLAEGKTPGEIFNGPLLRRGFIADDQLKQQAESIAVNDVIAAIGRTQGVLGVRHAEVRAGHASYGLNASIPVPRDRYLHLDTKPLEHRRGFPIRLLRNGVVCYPDPDGVAHELSMLWASYRTSYPLEIQYHEYFGPPRGEWRDVRRYYSIQNQFPAIYGIGYYGLTPDASPERRGQAKQFKGYLLPFEQLMSDYFAQLSEIGNLFSIDPDPWATYYSQSLMKSVPQVEPVLAPGYEEGLKKIVASGDEFIDRRNRFLSYLLRLYADNLSGSQAGCDSRSAQRRRQEKLLRARLDFLRLLVPATRMRGRGFDYRARLSWRNIAGMEIKCRIEMGLDLEKHRPLNDELAAADLKLTRSSERSSTANFDRVEDRFRPVAEFSEPPNALESPATLRGTSLTEAFVDAVRKPGNLLVGTLPGSDAVALVCRFDSGEPVIIDMFPDLETALREAYAILRQTERIHRARTQLYIVEHNLLRFGRRRKPHGDFEYNFTLTAVAGLPKHERMSRDNRTMVAEIVRENTPAHIVAQVCFLDPCRMLTFEHLYFTWRGALYSRNRFAMAVTSARLRRFLERQHRSTVTPEI